MGTSLSDNARHRHHRYHSNQRMLYVTHVVDGTIAIDDNVPSASCHQGGMKQQPRVSVCGCSIYLSLPHPLKQLLIVHQSTVNPSDWNSSTRNIKPITRTPGPQTSTQNSNPSARNIKLIINVRRHAITTRASLHLAHSR